MTAMVMVALIAVGWIAVRSYAIHVQAGNSPNAIVKRFKASRQQAPGNLEGPRLNWECVSTRGVTVRLKSGRQEDGYINWPTRDKDGPNLPEWSRAQRSRPLFLFRRVEKVRYPSERYVVARESILRIESNDIESLLPNRSLPLNVSVTNGLTLMAFSHKEIELLQRERPLYVVECEHLISAEVFIVFRSDIGVENLLSYLATRHRLWNPSDEGSQIYVKVDDKVIWSRRNSPEVESDSIRIRRLLDGCAQFMAIAEAARAPFERGAERCYGGKTPHFDNDCITRECREAARRKWDECLEGLALDRLNRSYNRTGPPVMWGHDIIRYYYAWD